MTKTEAFNKLNAVHPTDDAWYKNPALTWKQAYDIVVLAIEGIKKEEVPEWLSRRVGEVLKNKKGKKCPNCEYVIY